MPSKRIIIIGGGFAGVKCAKTLARELSPNQAEVVLFNRENHLVFSPLLAEVVGSSINPVDVIVPLRQLLPGVFCRMERVRGIYRETNEIEYDAEDGHPARMSYDHLVLACGNATNLNLVPGMADHTFPLKTFADCYRLRNHLVSVLEMASIETNPEERRRLLTFVVAGGNYAGVEVA